MRVKPGLIIITLKKNEFDVVSTAKELSIHKTTVYRWVKKARSIRNRLELSSRNLKRQSTKPHRIHSKLTREVKQDIVRVRTADHVGADKIKYLLKMDESAMIIHRYLKSQNLVEKQVKYRRPKFQNGKAMRPSNVTSLGYLQMDTKHVTPELSGLPFTVFEYAAIDILSRYKLAVVFPEINDENASLALEFFIKWFPFKIKYIQTDNGLEYQYTFDNTCKKYNITHYYIHKNTPNENAVIERSFRTDQDEFYYWLENPASHIGELNEWLQIFINKYNTYRPHQSLNYLTPLEFVKKVANVVLP